MANKYLKYISDAHLINCIENLFEAYEAAKSSIDKKKFYENKIDPIKFIFDSKFNETSEKNMLEYEIIRQIDKSINNAIGTFHEEILGGIKGYQKGNLSGYDIKADNDSLFADIKNKHNTMNSGAAESLFLKLKKFADDYPKSKCYWVAIWSKSSYNELWKARLNGKDYSHKRVYKISGDQFYKLLSGRDNALFELYKILPIAIDDFLKNRPLSKKNTGSAINEITQSAKDAGRSILDQIAYDNFNYYSGFDEL